MKVLNFEKNFISKSYLTISVLGNSYKLNIKYTASNSIELTKKDFEFELVLPKKYKNCDNLDIINLSIQKLYSELAPKELEEALELVRHIVKFAPEDYKIENLKDEYYKIAKNKILVISPDIIQYNREIINTTLIQAFCRMKFRPNSKAYKETLKNAINCYEEYKLQAKKENSRLKIAIA